MRSKWLALGASFAVAVGATVGVTAAIDDDDASSSAAVGPPLAVIGPADGVLGPEPAPSTDAEPASGGGSGSSGGGGAATPSGDESGAASALELLEPTDGEPDGGIRFIDPCAPPEGDAGCEGTTAAITGGFEVPPLLFRVEPGHCFAGDIIFGLEFDDPDAPLFPSDGVPLGTPFAIQSSKPARFTVRAGLEPGANDVTARASTAPDVTAEWDARLSEGIVTQYVATCIGIPFPDRTGLWSLEFTAEAIHSTETAVEVITFDTTATRPRPPVLVETPSDFGEGSRYEIVVTAPAFDHPTDEGQSREPAISLVTRDGPATFTCNRAGGEQELGNPTVRSSDPLSEGPRRVPRPGDADSPYDPGWDRFVTAYFGAATLQQSGDYVVCVQWADGAGAVVDAVAIPIRAPNRYTYTTSITDIRFRKKTLPSDLTVRAFGCSMRPFQSQHPERVRRLEDPSASGCVASGLQYPHGSLLDIASGGPVVPFRIVMPQGEVTRYVPLPGGPCRTDALPGECAPLEFEEEFVLPLVDLDQGLCGSGFPGRSCRNHRSAGDVTIRVALTSSNDPPGAAGWIVGDELRPEDEFSREIAPCTTGCQLRRLP